VEWDVSGFRVAVLDVQPYPVTGRPIAQEDYIARVVVRRS
jgi:hypothetical protein